MRPRCPCEEPRRRVSGPCTAPLGSSPATARWWLRPGCALLGCLRSLSAGVWAQISLEETGGGLRAPGDSVLLSCRGYGFNFGGSFIRWYRQAPGGRPEWVSFINPFSTQMDSAAAVEGRATVSRDNSRSETYLSLRALKPQDSARYFCATSHRDRKSS
uniref:Ig-like domain-containing protein n=1 Tax=Amazona collaria TaxID=241587 RepID=A0A8B9G4J7_9PSIT